MTSLFFFSNILFYEIYRRDSSSFLIQMKKYINTNISYALKWENIEYIFYNNLFGINENAPEMEIK